MFEHQDLIYINKEIMPFELTFDVDLNIEQNLVLSKPKKIHDKEEIIITNLRDNNEKYRSRRYGNTGRIREIF